MEVIVVKSDEPADICGLISYYVNELEKKELKVRNAKEEKSEN